jgi:DNA-binding transcriptional regulator YiaG
MTPAELRAARKTLGLTLTGMAEALRLGPNGERTIRRWERGDVSITGPASVALEYMLRDSDTHPKGGDAKQGSVP